MVETNLRTLTLLAWLAPATSFSSTPDESCYDDPMFFTSDLNACMEQLAQVYELRAQGLDITDYLSNTYPDNPDLTAPYTYVVAVPDADSLTILAHPFLRVGDDPNYASEKELHYRRLARVNHRGFAWSDSDSFVTDDSIRDGSTVYSDGSTAKSYIHVLLGELGDETRSVASCGFQETGKMGPQGCVRDLAVELLNEKKGVYAQEDLQTCLELNSNVREAYMALTDPSLADFRQIVAATWKFSRADDPLSECDNTKFVDDDCLVDLPYTYASMLPNARNTTLYESLVSSVVLAHPFEREVRVDEWLKEADSRNAAILRIWKAGLDAFVDAQKYSSAWFVENKHRLWRDGQDGALRLTWSSYNTRATEANLGGDSVFEEDAQVGDYNPNLATSVYRKDKIHTILDARGGEAAALKARLLVSCSLQEVSLLGPTSKEKLSGHVNEEPIRT